MVSEVGVGEVWWLKAGHAACDGHARRPTPGHRPALSSTAAGSTSEREKGGGPAHPTGRGGWSARYHSPHRASARGHHWAPRRADRVAARFGPPPLFNIHNGQRSIPQDYRP